MKHILAHIKKEDIKTDPFPHVIIENAIDDTLCRELIAQYPSLDILTKGALLGDNKRFSFNAQDVRTSGDVPPLWKSFIEAHISQEFSQAVVALFGKHIAHVYPDFENRYGDLETFRAGVRNIDTHNRADVLLDAQICVNTPVVREPSSVKIAHIDDADKLFAGLFYLRQPDDDSEGGGLELYRFRSARKKFHGSRLVDRRYVETVKTIPYKANTLIFFINSLDSLHGVTPRLPTQYTRLFVNLVGEVKAPLFDLTPYMENRAERVLRKWRLR